MTRLRLVASNGKRLPRIFITCNACIPDHYGEIHHMMAVSEDGYQLASHVSSTHSWGQEDMQHETKQKAYRKKYPDGFLLEWVDDPRPGKHSGIDAARKAALSRQKGGAA